MPFSARENDADVRRWVRETGVKTVLDIGPGSGTYADLLGDLCMLDAIEAWEPYVPEFRLTSKYGFVRVEDVRETAKRETPFVLSPVVGLRKHDLIIFGDVLEHMTAEEAQEVWAWGAQVANHRMMSVPIIHYPQGAEHGNPYEVHVQEHLTPEDVRQSFGPFTHEWVYDITATFVSEGK